MPLLTTTSTFGLNELGIFSRNYYKFTAESVEKEFSQVNNI